MSTKTSTRSYRVDYRQYEAVPQERRDEVADFYRQLTGRGLFPKVVALLAVVTRIHGDDTERRMQEAFELVGVTDMLRVLADTFRDEPLHVTEQQRRAGMKAVGRGAVAEEPPLPDPEPGPADEPVFAVLPPDFPPAPLVGFEDAPTPVSSPNASEVSEPSPSVPPASGADASGGFIYANGLEWDRRYWEREAARRAAEGDLTVAARLAFWELLPPEEQFLPEPTDANDARLS